MTVITVVVLHDRPLSARPDATDAIVQAKAVSETLRGLGIDAVIRPVGPDLAALLEYLQHTRPAYVFNLVESLAGEGHLIHVVPAVLEALRIPMTGCSARSQFLTSNKPLAKICLTAAGIATPPSYPQADTERGPWIIKSVWEHASFQLDASSIVGTGESVVQQIATRRARFGGRWFAERYIEGRELNVAMIESDQGLRTLPVSEIEFDGLPRNMPRIVSYAAKWLPESAEYQYAQRRFLAPDALTSRVEQIANECWSLFELGGYARVDFRIDSDGFPWVLEVNANPCLAPDAGFASALQAAGISFATAVGWITNSAMRRSRPVNPPLRHAAV